MNWDLVEPQFYGLLLFMILALASLCVTILGVFWIVWQINRSRVTALDAKILSIADGSASRHVGPLESQLDRLKQTTEYQHRETMTLLGELEKRLPNRDVVNGYDARIKALEAKVQDQKEELTDLFQRMRKVEISCSRGHQPAPHQPAQTLDDTSIPEYIAQPPRAR